VLRKRLAVLVAAAVMVLSMLAVSAPAFAQGEGGCDLNPGQSEGSLSQSPTPPTENQAVSDGVAKRTNTTRTLERDSVTA
jgi:hypothetical protein